MPARSGSFSGLAGLGSQSLDPFGSGRGGLGRYNVGDTLSSLEAYERYAMGVAWQNGMATDEEYLASLHRWIELSAEGTKERVSAQNAYDDAVYTIGRNKLVRDINNAPTDGQRVTALQALAAYDREKLGTMVEDNEQRRALADKIAGTEASVRETRWSQLVRRYNNNEVGNAALLDFARSARTQAAGAPDQQTWADRITEFSERVQTEHLTQLEQDYQMERVDGGVVLAFIDQMMSGMSHDSPRYAELLRHREDFAKSFRADDNAKDYASMYDKYTEGKISDGDWLRFLQTRVENSPAGSDERKSAKHDLVMETFRVTESRLYYNVTVNGESPNTLVNFYKTTLATLNHGSDRFRDIKAKIREIELNGIDSIDLGGDTASSGGGVNNPDGHAPGGPRNNNLGPQGPTETAYGKGGQAWNRPVQHGASSTPTKDGITIDQFLVALAAGEGKNNYQAQNPDTGAYGKYQHLPQYWPDRAARWLGDRNAPMTPENQEKVTRLIVQKMYDNMGDWRFVALAWHNGNADNRNPATWSAKNQKYVNRMMRRLGSDMWTPTTTEGIYLPNDLLPYFDGTRPPSHTGSTGNGGRNNTGRNNNTGTTNTNNNGGGQQPSVDHPSSNIPGGYQDVAKEIIRAVGGDPNNEQAVRAISVWLNNENGGSIRNNNPLNLTADSPNDWPGQSYQNGGYAVFRTWQAGVAAAAQDIIANYPALAQGIRKGNAESILKAISDPENPWRSDNYGGKDAIIKAYNATKPDRYIITGDRLYDTPASIATLAAQFGYAGGSPDAGDRSAGYGGKQLGDLFEVQPDDPGAMDWFEQNLASMERAAQSGASKWTFHTANGREVSLAFDPSMLGEMYKARADYAKRDGDTETEFHYSNKRMNLEGDITTEQLANSLSVGNRLMSTYLANGNTAAAINVATQMLHGAQDAMERLGLPPGSPLNVNLLPAGTLSAEDAGAVQKLLNGFRPFTAADPLSGDPGNPDGNKLLGLLENQADPTTGRARNVNPATGKPAFTLLNKNDQTGLYTQAALDPNSVYFTQERDGSVKMHSFNDPQDAPDFELVATVNSSGESMWQPKYLKDPDHPRVLVNINGLGVPVMVDVQKGDMPIGIIDNAPTPAAVVPDTGVANGTTPSPTGTFNWTLPTGQQWSVSMPHGTPGAQMPGAQMPGAQPTGQNPYGAEFWEFRNTPVSPLYRNDAPTITVPINYSLPVNYVEFTDPETGDRFRAYTLDEPLGPTAQWVLTPVDTAVRPPMPVFDPSKARYNSQTGAFEVNINGEWKKYDAATDGPLTRFGGHFYGQDPRDGQNPNGNIGAPNEWMPTRVGAAGTLNFKLSLYDRQGIRDGVASDIIMDREETTRLALQTKAYNQNKVTPNVNAQTGFVIPRQATEADRITGSTQVSIVRRFTQNANNATSLTPLGTTPNVNAQTGFTMPGAVAPKAAPVTPTVPVVANKTYASPDAADRRTPVPTIADPLPTKKTTTQKATLPKPKPATPQAPADSRYAGKSLPGLDF